MKPEQANWLRQMRGSGDALVVLQTQGLAVRMVRAFEEAKQQEPQMLRALAPWAVFEYQGRRFTLSAVEKVHNEPAGILWANFHPGRNIYQTCVLVLLSAALLMGAIGIYIFLLYLYVLYYLHLVEVPGVPASFVQDVLIGLLAALGNAAVVDPTVTYVSDRVGFAKKDLRDATRMILLFFGMTLMLVLDVWVAAVVADQIMVENAFLGKVEGPDVVLAGSIYATIVPGYLFLGPFVGLLGTVVLPYIVGFLLVPTRNLRRRDAERMLEPPEFDAVNRYGEVLTNFTVVLVLGVAASGHSWWVMICLVIYCLLVNLVDRAVLLRYSSETEYTTGRLSNCFALLWGVPSAGMAGAVCVVGHLIVYLSALTLVQRHLARRQQRKAEKSDMPYASMEQQLRSRGNPRTYFNTNPIFCLRSWFLPPEESGWDRIGQKHQRLEG